MEVIRASLAACVISALLSAPLAFSQKYLFNRLDLATGSSPQGVAVADFNKDGISDFAVANTASGTISVFLGKSNGTFQLPATLATGTASAPTAVIAADLNLDGKIDLAVTLNRAYNVMYSPVTAMAHLAARLRFQWAQVQLP